jgi:DNA-directed RNA polymerase beta' subunit
MRKTLFLVVLFYPLVSLAQEVSIQLAEPTSTIVIARREGEVENIYFKEGSYVTGKSIVLSIKNDFSTTEVVAMFDGTIKQYGSSIKQGSHVDSGDFLVEILDGKLRGRLMVKNALLDMTRMFENEIYCCLKLGDKMVNIQIDDIRDSKDIKIYFFSIDTQEKKIYELISKGQVKSEEIIFELKKVDLKNDM